MTRINNLDDMRKNFSQDVVALNSGLWEESVGPSLYPIAGEPSTPKRGNKYGAKRVEIQGKVFDSQKEARRWLELRQQVVHGQISDLARQVLFVLLEGFDYHGERVRPVTYRADFTYWKDGILYIEDVKSIATAKTESFRMRWRLLQHKFKDDNSVRCIVT